MLSVGVFIAIFQLISIDSQKVSIYIYIYTNNAKLAKVKYLDEKSKPLYLMMHQYLIFI
jgi:hypothetical protein